MAEEVKKTRVRNKKSSMTPEEHKEIQGKRSFKKKVNVMNLKEVESELNRLRKARHEQSQYYKDLMKNRFLLMIKT